MTTFVECWVHEYGWLTLLAHIIIGLIALALTIWLIFLAAQKDQDGNTEILGVTFSGPARLVATLFTLAVAIYSAYAILDEALSTRVAFDSPNTPVTLGQIAEKYARDTRSTFNVDSEAAKLEVQGAFEGRCVSDMVGYICRQYEKDIDCEFNYREIKISRRI